MNTDQENISSTPVPFNAIQNKFKNKNINQNASSTSSSSSLYYNDSGMSSFNQTQFNSNPVQRNLFDTKINTSVSSSINSLKTSKSLAENEICMNFDENEMEISDHGGEEVEEDEDMKDDTPTMENQNVPKQIFIRKDYRAK